MSIVASIVILLAAIHLSYEHLVAPYYAYMKLTYTSPDVPVYLTMLALIVALAFIMPTRLSRPADFLLWIVYLLVVIPSLTISHLARTLTTVPQLMLGFTVAATFGMVVLAGRLPAGWLAGRLPAGWLAGRVKPLPARVFWAIVIVISAVTYGELARGGQLTLSLPGLGDVYAVRGAFSEALGGDKLLGYLIPTQSAVINPILMASGISRRKPWLVVVGVVAELLLYGAGGHKSVLFSIPAILAVAIVYGRSRRPSGALFSWGVAAVIGLSAIVDEFLSTPWLTSLFTRRVVDVPGLLTGAWIHTYETLPKANYAFSFLSPFLPYDATATPPFVVADKYFGVPTMNANANLFASGYANLGWYGIVLEALVLAAIIAVVNASADRVPLTVAVMLLAAPSVSLVNGSVFTSLLSHGVLAVLLVLTFAPPSVWVNSPERAKAEDPPAVAGAATPPGGDDGVPAPGPSWWQRRKAASRTAG